MSDKKPGDPQPAPDPEHRDIRSEQPPVPRHLLFSGEATKEPERDPDPEPTQWGAMVDPSRCPSVAALTGHPCVVTGPHRVHRYHEAERHVPKFEEIDVEDIEKIQSCAETCRRHNGPCMYRLDHKCNHRFPCCLHVVPAGDPVGDFVARAEAAFTAPAPDALYNYDAWSEANGHEPLNAHECHPRYPDSVPAAVTGAPSEVGLPSNPVERGKMLEAMGADGVAELVFGEAAVGADPDQVIIDRAKSAASAGRAVMPGYEPERLRYIPCAILADILGCAAEREAVEGAVRNQFGRIERQRRVLSGLEARHQLDKERIAAAESDRDAAVKRAEGAERLLGEAQTDLLELTAWKASTGAWQSWARRLFDGIHESWIDTIVREHVAARLERLRTRLSELEAREAPEVLWERCRRACWDMLVANGRHLSSNFVITELVPYEPPTGGKSGGVGT